MRLPTFSIVIPAYNQAEYLPETIQSVLNQTFSDFEIIVVNDSSPDNTTEVISSIKDPRIKLIVHEKNKGLPSTRNTGMRAANGKYIALLDADDLFHPQKLELHAAFLDQHPEIAVTYNSRYQLDSSATTIRELSRSPLTVGLRDFIHGYPFTPSDMVIRKNIVERVGYFDERFIAGGEDMEYPATLALAGCKFASVDRSLNYRRHHSGSYRKNLNARLKDVQDVLAKIYADPRCPEEIRRLGKTPLSEHYIVLIYLAFIQDRTQDGQHFLHDLVRINPGVLQGWPCRVVKYFTAHSTADYRDNHVEILRRLFSQLPELPVNIADQLEWAVQQGFLIKGVRAALWGSEDVVAKCLQRAIELGGQFSEGYLRSVAQHMANYEIEMGREAAQAALQRLSPFIQRLSSSSLHRFFLGELSAIRAFENFRRGRYRYVPGNVFDAIRRQPRFIKNRGMLSLFARSIIKI